VALRHRGYSGHLDHIADIVVLAPPSTATLLDSTPSLPLSNGLKTPNGISTLTTDDAHYESESDLSEVIIPPVEPPSPATSSNQFGGQDTDASDSSPENQNASDDADYDMEESPAPVTANEPRDDGSTSSESRRPAKRKLVSEDQHMLENPELYGLRRSVCVLLTPHRRLPC
jgi:chromodomain-helicase-DNA-binding protein 1